MKIRLETLVHQNFEKVIAGFNQDLFEALKPPLLNMELERYDGSEKGDIVSLSIHFMGRKLEWRSLISENGKSENEMWFVDIGEKLPPPLKTWHHRHSVIRLSQFKSKIVDDINFTCQNKALELAMYPLLYAQFAYRIPVYKRYFNGLEN